MVWRGSEFFQVPEPRRKLGLGIVPSPSAYVEEKRLEFFQVPKSRRKLGLGIFSSPSGYIEGKRTEFL